jgi:predicted permease
MFRGLVSDLRYALRVLRRSPGFTLVAVLSLGLGLGANTAMYSVIRALLLSPMPVQKPSELWLLTWRRDKDQDFSQINSTSYTDPESGASYRSNFSSPIYRALRGGAPAGAQLTAFSFLRGVSVAVANQPALIAPGVFADGHYFATVRPAIALGRPLDARDDSPAAPLTVVLSHSLWLRAFGGDPAAIGQTVRVNGVPAVVVGVTEAGFRGLSMGGFFPQTDITIPLSAQPRVYARLSDKPLDAADDIFWLRVLARVPENVPIATATSAFTTAFRAVDSPANVGDAPPATLKLMDGSHGAQPLRGESAKLLYLLNIVVALVLLIACMNLASLMLARGVSRQREMAVRKALGGGRGRLVRQNLLESLLLGAAGTALGLLLTFWARSPMAVLLSGVVGNSAFGGVEVDIALDPVILLVSAALGLAATLLFGLLPALRLAGLDPMAWLKQRAAGAAVPRLGVSRALIGVQIAVTVPLVVGAVLFLRTISNLGAVPLGFDPSNLAIFRLDPGYTRLPEDEYPRLYQQVLANVQAIPGVRSVTLLENALLSGIVSNTSVLVNGERKQLYKNAVGPDFLQTMGVRLLAGRVPGMQDVEGAPLVGAVNETAVRKLFGGSSPVGQTIRIGESDVLIVGVVSDVRYSSQRDSTPSTIYDSALQRPGWGGHHIVLRTDVPLARLQEAVRAAVARVDSDLPVPEIRSQTDVMLQTSAREHLFTQLLTLFGVLALLLASIGLHGVTAYSVTRRTSEIGVRVAVGAKPGQVLWLVLRQVVALAGLGLAIGVPVSLIAGESVRSLLFGVAPNDVPALIGAAALMLAVAVAAGLAPAWRAARLDPLIALRAE